MSWFKLETEIRDYFNCVEEYILKLSRLKEGSLSKVPRWALSKKNISLYLAGRRFVVLMALPDPKMKNNTIDFKEYHTTKEPSHALAKHGISVNFKSLKNVCLALCDISFAPTGNPLLKPYFHDPGLIMYGSLDKFREMITIQRAKKDAIDIWNNANSKLPQNNNYIQNVRNIFDAFETMFTNQKYKERSIHRFIHEHAGLILPEHVNVFFEHRIKNDKGEYRDADFILERQKGLPPILIELERPDVKFMKKNKEPAQTLNHAKFQINEWVSLIDRCPNINAQKEMSFLKGPNKERLVIIGRGIDYEDELLQEKFGGVTVWTYDMLLREAKKQQNKDMERQYKTLDMKKPKEPFF